MTIRIYLAEQTGPNARKYEIYREGKPTGEIVGIKTIKKMLTSDQYQQFINGDDIFLVNGQKFRSRNYKEKNVNRKIDF